ncbi:MAG: tetratricopeptide repeat protein [Edaphobacter sp.]
MTFHRRFIFALLLLASLLAGRAGAIAQTVPSRENPDAVCAKCHREIYSSYEKTPMARASGAAVDGLLPGEFTHTASGVHYRLFLRDGRAWLSYERPGAVPERSLKGEQELVYFVGSGKRGRTYLFQKSGFWFESPVNWYSKLRVWDMNPKSLDAREMPFTLQVDRSCLHCHASAVQAALPGAKNHFAAQPFLHAGITCESCHGDPSKHLADGGKGAILNPARLTPGRRDSICLQCHLEGVMAVNRVGRSIASFVPGEELSDYVAHFVYAGELGASGRATSQWEALLQSKCKRKSGDRLTCTTCHNPHSSPTLEERVSYFRGKCLACHTGEFFANKHHPEQRDCASCHMPREKTENVAHEQVTDHRIQRPLKFERASSQDAKAHSGELMSVSGAPASDRDLGLAYAQLAEHGNQDAGRKAMLLLDQAERSDGQKQDPDLHTALGFLEQISQNLEGAMREYEAALLADPFNSIASGDLAILKARSGDVKGAVALWQSVSRDDPSEVAASWDLATVECAIGEPQAATRTLERLLDFSPDNQRARQMLIAVRDGKQHCGR